MAHRTEGLVCPLAEQNTRWLSGEDTGLPGRSTECSRRAGLRGYPDGHWNQTPVQWEQHLEPEGAPSEHRTCHRMLRMQGKEWAHASSNWPLK